VRHEDAVIRDQFFALALAGWLILLAVAELIWVPRNEPKDLSGDHRLTTNFGLWVIVLFVGGLLPLAKVASSALGQSMDIGVARQIAMPWLAVFALALVTNSLALYWAHRLMHATPLLWRVHRVHHADEAVDVSTSLRNHPLELIVTMPVAAGVILAVGSPVSVVVAVQTVQVAATLWQHASIALPRSLDRTLAWVIITPRLHRLHHSPERPHHDSNYGELFSLWDRIFGTLTTIEERNRVGLNDQLARSDRLLQQIWSPVHAV
jgi:sterol desaturase/sphingolipid hydroxylase (fatty acid hydroxylase superfamily)